MEIARSFRQFAKTAFVAVARQNVDPGQVKGVLDRARKEIEVLGARKSKRDTV